MDDPARVIVGDSLTALRTLPDGCVHACITSPPYWSLRDYGTGRWEGGDAGCDHKAPPKGGPHTVSTLGPKRDGLGPDNAAWAESKREHQYRDQCRKCGAVRIDRQIGLEDTPAAFVARLVEVFREVRRVLHPSGCLFVNIGDSYAAGGMGQGSGKQLTNRGTSTGGHMDKPRKAPIGLKPKDLCGAPWMLAFALREDGWYLRSDIIWHKPAPMPESVTDRPTKAHEYVFMLTKRADYFYDAEAVAEPASQPGGEPRQTGQHKILAETMQQHGRGNGSTLGTNQGSATRNKRTVWTIASDPYPGAHFATFPPALVEPMVKAGSSEKGCCPECWAPWTRVTSKTKLKRHRPNDLTKRDGTAGTGNHCPNTVAGVRVETLGWEPSCKCGREDVIPSLVLDPFAGSGTTLAVAVKLKRRALGIELNPEYAALCEKRLAEPLGTGGLFASETPVVTTLFPDPA